MKTKLAVLTALVLMGAGQTTASAQVSGNSTTNVICQVFGPYCSQALRVAWCESRYQTTAQNGQYLGLFQMGSYARARYGHGSDAYTQARAAYRYFIDAGHSWAPWTCRPW